MFSRVFLVCSNIILFLHLSQGLKCYVCNSEYNPGCDDVIPPTKYLVDCNVGPFLPNGSSTTYDTTTPTGVEESPVPTGQPESSSTPTAEQPKERRDLLPQGKWTFCRKNSFSIPPQNNNDSVKDYHARVIRSCGALTDGVKVGGCKWAANEGIQNFLCTCDTDSCNGVGTLIISSTLVLTVLLAKLTIA